MDNLPLFPSDGNPQKRCPKCKNVYPATSEFFHRKKSKKDGLHVYCKECNSADTRAYYAKNRENRRLYAEKYKEEHRDQIKSYKDKYNLEHRDQHKTYLQANRDRISAQRKNYYREHQDRLRSYSAWYRSTEIGRMSVKAWNHKRKAHKRQAGGSHTAQELQEQLKRQKSRCYYCKAKLGKGKGAWHADHIVPLSKGGRNSIDNIVIACPSCNQSKYNKMLHEWTDGGRLC